VSTTRLRNFVADFTRLANELEDSEEKYLKVGKALLAVDLTGSTDRCNVGSAFPWREAQEPRIE
jgi:hypothetical protein